MRSLDPGGRSGGGGAGKEGPWAPKKGIRGPGGHQGTGRGGRGRAGETRLLPARLRGSLRPQSAEPCTRHSQEAAAAPSTEHRAPSTRGGTSRWVPAEPPPRPRSRGPPRPPAPPNPSPPSPYRGVGAAEQTDHQQEQPPARVGSVAPQRAQGRRRRGARRVPLQPRHRRGRSGRGGTALGGGAGAGAGAGARSVRRGQGPGDADSARRIVGKCRPRTLGQSRPRGPAEDTPTWVGRGRRGPCVSGNGCGKASGRPRPRTDGRTDAPQAREQPPACGTGLEPVPPLPGPAGGRTRPCGGPGGAGRPVLLPRKGRR